MDVLVLIDRLEEMVEDARSFPGFGNTAMVDRDAAYDLIDQMRQSIPEELKQARWIVKERQSMLDEARSESDRIVQQAREEAEKLVSEEEVIKQAEKQGADIVEDSRRREREVRLGAEDYADDVLGNLEDNLGRLLGAVQRGRSRLQGEEDDSER
jgi:F0F1-type ATP synthase membrane subunit b/b'